jgi:hypothetical protein
LGHEPLKSGEGDILMGYLLILINNKDLFCGFKNVCLTIIVWRSLHSDLIYEPDADIV